MYAIRSYYAEFGNRFDADSGVIANGGPHFVTEEVYDPVGVLGT